MSEEEGKRDAIEELSKVLIEKLLKYGRVELENVVIEADKLELWIEAGVPRVVKERLVPPVRVKPKELVEAEFVRPEIEWPGKVLEVKLGATSAEGGTRDRVFTIGGQTSPLYYSLDPPRNRPVIALDVFDMKVSLPRAIKQHFGDVLEDPVEWARKCVEEHGAKMINLHLISTDPTLKDTPASKAAKVVEDVLQAVKVPLTIGGSGNPEKDVKVFEKVAEVGEGERLLINSLNLDMDLERMAKAVNEHGHVAIAFTPMNLEEARELNRKLYEYLPRDRITMDTNVAGVGYGLQYGFTVMERARLAALKGDEELQHPIVAGVTNSWAAREAWMKMDPEWGPRELRGPIWEAMSGLSFLLAGADYLMMMHPLSVRTLEDVIDSIMEVRELSEEESGEGIISWVGQRF